MKALCCLLIALPSLALAKPGLFNMFDDCANPKFKIGECAHLYDDDGCEGWEYTVKTGYHELSWRRRNDVESVIVNAGCKFIGYDHDGQTEYERGDKIEIDATFSSRPVVRELKHTHMDERISSLVCTCGGGRPNYNGNAVGGSGSYGSYDKTPRPNYFSGK